MTQKPKKIINKFENEFNKLNLKNKIELVNVLKEMNLDKGKSKKREGYL